MRIAKPADYDQIEKIMHDQLRADWGRNFYEAGPAQVGGFRGMIGLTHRP